MQQPAGDRPAGKPARTRSVVMARNGAIATSQPLATAAGLRVLQSGRQRDRRRGHGGGGAGGRRADDERRGRRPLRHRLQREGQEGPRPERERPRAARPRRSRSSRSAASQRIPLRGELSVSVPGVVDGWSELLAKHGTRTLAQALEPAIKYARDGYAVSEIIAGPVEERRGACWRSDPNAAATFLIDGKAPAPGDVFRNPTLAASLELIAKGGRDAFYKGAIAKAIADDMQRRNGLLTAKDLADHHVRLGRAALDDLSRLPGARAAAEHAGRRRARDAEHPRGVRPQGARPQHRRLPAPAGRGQAHRVRRSRRLARPTRRRRRRRRSSGCSRRTTPRSAARRSTRTRRPPTTSRSRSTAGRTPGGGDEPVGRGDTIYLTAADADGNVISLIQSIYETFGSGIVAGDTGIVLHNRGNLFSLDARPSEPDRARQAAVPHARFRRWC